MTVLGSSGSSGPSEARSLGSLCLSTDGLGSPSTSSQM